MSSSDTAPHRAIRVLRREECPRHPLWQVHRPPRTLYVQGLPEAADRLLERLPNRAWAVVGTRRPQARTLSLVRDSILRLAGRDFVIVSGLARGVDTEAHRAALAAGLPTIAVLGTGLDVAYPVENVELREDILRAGGLVISEFPEGTEVIPTYFVHRNRLIAGWANAVWVAEAPTRSGALSTAKQARELARPVYATPTYPGDPSMAGNQTLLDRDGALPFWGPHSLGNLWLDCATLGGNSPHPATSRVSRGATRGSSRTFPRTFPWTNLDSDCARLCRQVHRQSAIYGGAQVEGLLGWAIAQDWEPARFFLALQKALANNWLRDEDGILTSA